MCSPAFSIRLFMGRRSGKCIVTVSEPFGAEFDDASNSTHTECRSRSPLPSIPVMQISPYQEDDPESRQYVPGPIVLQTVQERPVIDHPLAGLDNYIVRSVSLVNRSEIVVGQPCERGFSLPGQEHPQPDTMVRIDLLYVRNIYGGFTEDSLR